MLGRKPLGSPLEDNGWSSRKLHLTLLCIFLIIGMGFAGHFLSGIAAQLQVIVGGLLGALALYLGGNVADKFNATNLAKIMGPIRKVVPEPEVSGKIAVELSSKPAKNDSKASGSVSDSPPIETG